MANHKEVYIVGGPNGAGKTTFVKQFLPNYVKVRNFVNADDIAQGLSPLSAESMNIKSGKLMLGLIDEYMMKGLSFGFETTLAGKKWTYLIDDLKSRAYTVYIFFLDLYSIELSASRVKFRIESGGHAIPEETVRRRYPRARRNFWETYKDKADKWYLFDNSAETPALAAENSGDILSVVDREYFDFFVNSVEEGK